MTISKSTHLGQVAISKQAIATLAGNCAMQCYGVVGLASQNSHASDILKLLKQKSFAKGVEIIQDENKIDINIHLIFADGINISSTVGEIQKKIKYAIESAFNIEVDKINIIIQGIRVIK